jgi:mannitol operon transcriptional antiterminator
MLTLRQKELLNIMIKSNHIVTIHELASVMQLSDRTIRNDLKNLSHILKTFNVSLNLIPSKGVILENCSKIHLSEILNSNLVYDKDSRQNELKVLLLVYPTLSVKSLADRFYVDRQTISRDINDLIDSGWILKEEINRTTHGLKLVLDENKIREMFCDLMNIDELICFMKVEAENKLANINHRVTKWIDYLENEYKFEFENVSKNYLWIVASYLHYRFNDISNSHFEKAYLLSSDKFDLWWDKDGQLRLNKIIVSLRLIKGKLPIISDSNIIDELLAELIQTLNLSIEKTDESYLSLKLHLQAAINRSTFNQQIENPLKVDVRLSYSILFEAISAVLVKYEELHNIVFSENEVAFIVMHIGAIIQSQAKLQTKITVLVVCQHGTATSNLLHARLKMLMPNQNLAGPYSVNEFNKLKDSLDYDLIISTIPIDDQNSLIVSPLLKPYDIEMIERKLWNLLYQKQCDLLIKNFTVTHQDKISMSQMIKRNHFQFATKFNRWEDAIEYAAKPLINDRVILEQYITKMIWAVESLGPYMVILPKIAFVHAGNQDGVLRNGISCLRMSKPILFGNQKATEVQVIFVIASKEKEDMGLLKLVRIIENHDNYQTLLNTNDIEAIMALGS